MSKLKYFLFLLVLLVTAHVQAATATATWTSSTAQDTVTGDGLVVGSVMVSVAPSGSITGGGLIFEASTDNGVTFPYSVALARLDGTATDTTYALAATPAIAWQRSTVGLTNIRVRLNPAITGSGNIVITISSSPSPAGPSVSINPGAGDPCQSAIYAKSSAVVTAGGKIISGVANKVTYVCAFYSTLGGTSPTIKFQYGSGTNCATSPVDLTGAFAIAPNGTQFFLGAGETAFSAPANATPQDVCIVLGGTSPTIAGVVTYVTR